MDSISKRHRRSFGKNFYQNKWLALELIATLGIIGLLLASFLRVAPQFFYKVSVAEPLWQYTITARAQQQEHFAWTGTFNNKRKDIPAPYGDDRKSSMSSQDNKTYIVTEPYNGLPSTAFTIELIPIASSVILPRCVSAETEWRHLLPYICKQR